MRGFLKGALIGAAMILILPLWILYRLESSLLGADKAFYGWSQLMSLFPGLPGNYLRFAFYKLSLAELGKDACICFGATLVHPGIRIGRGAYIGPHCNLGLCHIEDDVLLGTGVHVMSGLGQHGSADLDTPIRDQQGALRQVRVGTDTWVGNQAVIGADVGRKCIIGAASVVVKPLPEFAIAAGNPAKIIRLRTALEIAGSATKAREESGDGGG
jgi:virginiamycin A acetyltransferase